MQIEHPEASQRREPSWKDHSKSRKWMKKQTSRYIRRANKEIQDDEAGFKSGRKPTKGWEY